MSKETDLNAILEAVVVEACPPGTDGKTLALSPSRSQLCLFIRAAYSRLAIESGIYSLEEIAAVMNKTRPVVKPAAAMIDSGAVCGDGFASRFAGVKWNKAYGTIKSKVMPGGEGVPLPYAQGVAVSFDPSSKCTGYSVFKYGEPVEFGRIKPVSTQRGSTITAKALRKGEANMRRIVDLIAEVQAVLDEFKPQVAVVEVSTGKSGTGSKQGAKSSLITYGTAVGAVVALCLSECPDTLLVNERDWTKGMGAKARRILAVGSLYPSLYSKDKDKGGDIADSALLYLFAHKAYNLDSFFEAS